VTDHVEAVLAAADRAAGLTRQLLAFGRRQVLKPEVVDLNEIVRETDGLLKQLIGDNIELLTTLAEQPVLVKADRGMLEQVITNLALNARDAMPSGGVLRIQVARETSSGATAAAHARRC
jgi:signal transduction histidine kinase